MSRRTFLGSLAAMPSLRSLAPGGVAAGLVKATHAEGLDPKGSNLPAFDVSALQNQLERGSLTAVALTQACISRIDLIDRSGPRLRSVIELNPDAMAIAEDLDRERQAGKIRSPLHGIPILIKDNIATADSMQTTAGSLAMIGARAPRDAHLVTRLRNAGAIMLGKTNLSEWANIRSNRSTSGWSARGGLTRNPHALDRNTSGSSSGSAAATAAVLAPLTVGTETDGSIVSPASINGVVGFKPTVGLVSRDGIIPISRTQDTAGPMTRSVTDAALLLSAMAGPDTRDSATRSARTSDYMAALNLDALKGARLGIVRAAFTGNPRIDAVHEQALSILSGKGARLVDWVKLPSAEQYQDSEFSVLLYEMKAGLNSYLREFGRGAPVNSLADIIAFNETNAAQEMSHFGQELFLRAKELGGLRSKPYLAALETCQRLARTEGIDEALRRHELDALVAPTGGVAWLTDFVNGDHYTGSFSTPAAVAGYPHL
ncbi:MAG: amidase, partial [Betaproteobacteria bacterium]|nr:amidase [Betaproteobacteria bacterium]